MTMPVEVMEHGKQSTYEFIQCNPDCTFQDISDYSVWTETYTKGFLYDLFINDKIEFTLDENNVYHYSPKKRVLS